MMFLFAGHSDKPLKSLISMAHEGNHICLHRFSFIYVMGLTVVELRMFFSKLTTNSSAFIVSN